MPAYFVRYKQQGVWYTCCHTNNPSRAKKFARENIYHGNSIERIEVHDLTGPLETVYDSSWE
jgi:hypothetical protein